MIRCTSVVVAAALAWGVASRGVADDVPTGNADKDFVIKALAAQIAEINLGQKGLKNASSKKVRDFAQHMVTDHTKLKDALMEWAKSMKLAVVQGFEKEYKDKLNRLSKVEGANYDREFMKIMVEDHEKALKDFRSHAKTVSNASLKKLIQQSIPTIEEHLKEAKQVSSSL